MFSTRIPFVIAKRIVRPGARGSSGLTTMRGWLTPASLGRTALPPRGLFRARMSVPSESRMFQRVRWMARRSGVSRSA